MSRHTEQSTRGPRDARGFALIAVLVALSILLALAAPFLLSMSHGDDVARAAVSTKHAELSSASVRDLLLSQTAASAFTADEDPLSDGLDEFPAEVDLPAGFDALRDNGRVLLGGDVVDLQRKVDLNSTTPLMLANLLGLGARLEGDHPLDFDELTVDDVANFPEEGMLILDREVIRYGARDGNTFRDLTRGLFVELGFRPYLEPASDDENVYPGGTLLLDFRTVAAVALPIFPDFTKWRPYTAVRELSRISTLAAETFDAAETDLLDAVCTVASMRQFSTTWGKPERVFDIFPDELERPRILRVKSAADIGGGSIVRVRSTDGRLEEYAMVWSTSVPQGVIGRINLPRAWFVELLTPLNLDFEPLETTIEKLIPVPINVNTADPEVLAAMVQSLRQRPQTVLANGEQNRRPRPYVSRRRAEEIADRIVTLRTPDQEVAEQVDEGDQPRPFESWEDFERRVFRPMFNETTSRDQSNLLVLVYDVLQIGRSGGADMGTMPACFYSSSLVEYRAAALRGNPLRGGEDARSERQGVALAVPSGTEALQPDTQAEFEEMFRLDRRSPWWLTYPINTAALSPLDVATEPSVRTFAHVVADAYPDLGLGNARFPDSDTDEGSVKPSPSSTPFSWPGNVQSHERFSTANHPEGRDLNREGVYEIDNAGPRNPATGAMARPSTHSRIRFNLTHDGGLTSKHAMQFWFRLDDGSPQVLYDLSLSAEGDANRNRITFQLREQSLFFEVFDEAGLDPDAGSIDTTPARPVGTWEVPLTEIDFAPARWYHASLSAMGNAPSQMQLLIDGVPRMQPQLRTFLTQQIAPFQFNNTVPNNQQQAQLQLPIAVESTDGFPPRGVIKVGDELIEYTSINGNTFDTVRADSMGGRLERQSIAEFNVPLPISGTVSAQDLQEIWAGNQQAVLPLHEVGSAVEFYGYSLPVYPQRFLDAGAMQLSEAIGAFAMARVVNRQSSEGVEDIQLQPPNPGGGPAGNPITIGQGITANFDADLILAPPVTDDLSSGSPPSDPMVDAAFSTSGGYALLVQRNDDWQIPGGVPVRIGGVTVIRYGGRNGNRLTNVQLAVAIPGVPLPATDWFDPTTTSRFITFWNRDAFVGRPPLNEWPNYYTYVVPISLPVSGNIPAPSTVVEWAQIYPSGDERDTEWVRYNTVLENRFLVRAELLAFQRLLDAVSNNQRGQRIDIQATGPQIPNATDPTMPWEAPFDPTPNEIGYVDPLETTYPGIFYARRALGFRGDAETGTSAHAHAQADIVLPVHRFEFNWLENGALGARAGRNDRIGIVQGSARTAGQVPGVEWHSVNWTYRHYNADNVNPVVTRAPERELLGPHPFQLVALKAPIQSAFLGGADESRTLLDDPRILDRALKFPSGELPVVDADFASVGASGYQEAPAMRGIVDEITAIARAVAPRRLDSALPDSGNSFFIREAVTLTPLGPFANAQPRQWPQFGNQAQLPQDGGMLWIDGELIAYSNFDAANDEVTVATNGRGLLGTTPRSHDVGAICYFLEQVPTEILSAPLRVRDTQVAMQRLGGFPRFGGLVLVGTELIHYAWTANDGTLGMPGVFDPEQSDLRPEGMFRGRFGTNPVAVPGGSPVICYPFRYWDRYRERADDPESSYVQFTYDAGPGYALGFGWDEEGNSALVDLQCVYRIDGRGDFTADPAETKGLSLFRDGEVEGDVHRIGAFASRVEARFFVEYRPGCFDPVLFRAHDWKYAPLLRRFQHLYESEARILTERITAR